jgi:hypothetical protein
MCYTGGPRCSPHAKSDLDKAIVSGDLDRIHKAQQAYQLTPRGIQELRDQGRDDEAKLAAAVRKSQLAAKGNPATHESVADELVHHIQDMKLAELEVDVIIDDPESTTLSFTGYTPLEELILRRDASSPLINKVLDQIETIEAQQLFSIAAEPQFA